MAPREFVGDLDTYTEVGPLGIGGRRWRVWRAEASDKSPVVVKLPHSPADVAARWAAQVEVYRRIRGVQGPLGELFAVPYDFIDGEYGQIQPYMQGYTLQELIELWLTRRPTEDTMTRLRDRMWLAYQLAAAVEVLERIGVCHGDFSPGNVLLSKTASGPRLVLIDFDEAFERDAGGTSLGTEDYRAPEVDAGGGATWASDRYALSVLIHFLLTRRHPQQDNCRKPPPECFDWDGMARQRVQGWFGEGPVLQALERGLSMDPRQRPSAMLWRQVLAQAMDELYICRVCHFEIVAESLQAAIARPPCPACSGP